MEKKHTIKSLKKSFSKKEITPEAFAMETIENISKINPSLNIFLNWDADAAKESVSRNIKGLKDVENENEITAVPTSLKDNFNLVDTRTTASSKILADYISPYNATVTDRLIASNALILGKTNMDAFAHGSSTETSDFGPTLNPLNPKRLPGGSSGGAAAAVAAGLGVYALGSETAGSVRGPAAWCGIYGFVPTYGVHSRYGLIAMGSSLDRPGILANCVYDCALVSEKIAGHDKNDATSLQIDKFEFAKNFKPNLDSARTRKDAGKLVLGLPKQFLDERIDTEVRNAVAEVVKQLKSEGIEVKEIDLLDPKYSVAVYTIICRSEVSSNLARIDGIRYGHFADTVEASIIDQIALNRGEGFGNEAKQRSMTGAYALSSGYYDAYYKKAQKVRTLIIEDFNNAFLDVDLIIGPTMPSVAPELGVTANNPLFGELADVLTEPSALAGLPCISLPIGFNSENLPIGMQVFGPQLGDQQVLNFGGYVENLLK